MTEHGAFRLEAPDSGAGRGKDRRPREAGVYTREDHQWLLNLCNRYLTLSEFDVILKRGRFFQDYPELLRASVAYFGCVEMGWRARRVGKALGIHRDTIAAWIAIIEDVRLDGDVFDRISMHIQGRKDGLL